MSYIVATLFESDPSSWIEKCPFYDTFGMRDIRCNIRKVVRSRMGFAIAIRRWESLIGVGRFRILGVPSFRILGGPSFRILGGGQIPRRHMTS